jgi:hypothetical protein
MNMITRRLLEIVAMMLVGDGLLSMVDPKRHCGLWDFGPKACREFIEEFETHPNLTRILGAVEAVLGLVMAETLRPEKKESLMDRAQTMADSAVKKLKS